MIQATGIVAIDPRGVMGALGKLPWSYPEDLRFLQKPFEIIPSLWDERLGSLFQTSISMGGISLSFLAGCIHHNA